MPTAGEFRASARQFREAAEGLRRAPKESNNSLGADVLWGGALRASADDVVGRLRSDADALAAHLDRLAAECDARAVTTDLWASRWDHYDREYGRYAQEVLTYNATPYGTSAPPTVPLAPGTPPAWAEF